LAFGNIAGNGTESRDKLLQRGMLQLAPKYVLHGKPSVARAAAWLLANLCRSTPLPPITDFGECMTVLQRALTLTDENVVNDSLWTLSYISGTYPELIANNIELIQLMVRYVSNTQKCTAPTIRTIGNLASGPDYYTDQLIAGGVLPMVVGLLRGRCKSSLRREIYWTVSNMVSSTVQQIQAVIDAGILEYMINANATATADEAREIAWTLRNAFGTASADQKAWLLERRAMYHVMTTMLNGKKIAGTEQWLLTVADGCKDEVNAQFRDALQAHEYIHNSEVYTLVLEYLVNSASTDQPEQQPQHGAE
jgi:importin subunit alpha-6/7